MQLILQVLNKEQIGDAVKPAVAIGTQVFPEGEDAFASFLENPEGVDIDVTEAALTPETSPVDPIVRRTNDNGDSFRSISAVIPTVVGEARRQVTVSADKAEATNIVVPDDAKVATDKVPSPSSELVGRIAQPEPELKPAAVAAPSAPTDKQIFSDKPLASNGEYETDDTSRKVSAGEQTTKPIVEDTGKVISGNPLPIVSRPAPGFGGSEPNPRGREKPERIISREFSTERIAGEMANVRQDPRSTPPARVAPETDVEVQSASRPIPLTDVKAEAPVQQPLRDNPLQTLETMPLVAAKVTPNVAPTPSERLAKVRDDRSTRRDPAPDVTVTVKTAAPEPGQTTQLATLSKPAMVVKDTVSGSEAALTKDDGTTQATLTERSETSRKLDAVAPKFETAARPVITQIVQAAKTAVDGIIEVKLSPEELGRVRLTMTTGETGMTVLVTAERPETLDLLRRNIDLFAADLADQGFSDLNFSFGQDDAGDQKRNFAETGSEDGEVFVQSSDMSTHDTAAISPDGRLDLRL